ncbi:hypothetical protein CJ235_02210 [Staphylococcus pettenkoferi]|uniref:DUF3310 domain-containing protein n=1 Tax=Staphylococcus pettenkoferi TaxID=170573 RepID=A0A2N6QLE4_9STAP|nr:hypothetical protein CJ235_02210 [Staphylococcus pettenkoferi]
MMLKKVKVQDLNVGDKIIYYGFDEESQYLEGAKATVKKSYMESYPFESVAVIQFEDSTEERICDADYFDLIVESNDLQQRKRHQMNQVPNHYQGTDGIDVIEFCRQQFTHDELVGALKFNIIKYTTRLGRKENDLEDLNKIGVYQRRLSEVLADE